VIYFFHAANIMGKTINRKTCPYTTLAEYKGSINRRAVKTSIQDRKGANWWKGPNGKSLTPAQKKVMFAEERIRLINRLNAQFANRKTLEQLKQLTDQDRVAEKGYPTCGVCKTHTGQVARGCEHVFCIACTIRLHPTCAVCTHSHTGTYVLVTDPGSV
jgi:hypothetical protein